MINSNTRFEAAIYGLPVGRPEHPGHAREPLEVLASEFLAELRNGERPSVDDYADRHPELADEIQEMLPLLLAMEGWKDYRERTAFEHRALTTLSHGRFGEFRIVREIGRGGMGIVFEAQGRFARRRVAIKVLPFLRSSDWRERFEREARTAARLRHPHVVPVFNFGEHEGLCFYVMRLIHGVGLDWVIECLTGNRGLVLPRDISARFLTSAVPMNGENPASTGALALPDPDPLVDEGTIAPEPVAMKESDDRNLVSPRSFASGLARNSWLEFARIGAQVADALQHAHAHGTLHRDIKPANLLLDAEGDIWITDFGLAQNTDELIEHESTGVAGTLRYIAPEQFTGVTDARSDIYSLGVTLYELLTRTPAFQARDRTSLIESIIHSTIPRPRDINPKIPRDLEAIVVKATAKEPAMRYASAAELLADLVRFLIGQRVQASGAMGWLRFRSTSDPTIAG